MKSAAKPAEPAPVMIYCKRCLEPNTRPDSVFDEEGVCLPCRLLETAHEIDWEARRRDLDAIVAWGKARNVSGYDCIIPVSGGKDSHRQAMYCRDVLGMKALLVSCGYPPEQQTERGAHNIGNLINLGFDCIYVSPAPETWRKLMRAGFFRWGNMFKSTELALYASAPKIATAWHIPLVIYGENPSLSWGSAGGSMNEDANQLRFSNTLQGGDVSWLLEAGFNLKEIYWYRYPPDRDVRRANLRMIYLGYFIHDFNDATNGRLAMEWGLRPREGEDAIPEDIGQVTTYDALDDDFVIVNQMLKQLKFGFGKASEQCSGMIRNGEITRERGLELANAYDGRCAHRYLRAFCDYIGVSEDEFWEQAERWRNRSIWEQDGNTWTLRYPLS